MNTLTERHSQEKLSLQGQRERLLELNPDLIYGVYEIIKEDNSEGKEVRLEMVSDIMCCYENQFPHLKGIDQAPRITLVSLSALQNKEIQILNGVESLHYKILKHKEESKKAYDHRYKSQIAQNLTLLSGGVIEYKKSSQGNKHMMLTLRDDGKGYTSPAGRCSGEDIQGEMMREYYEEGCFVTQDKKGNYHLALPDGKREYQQYTQEAVRFFIDNKYNLKSGESDDSAIIKKFERLFPGISYDELGKILEEILQEKRFVFYRWKEGNIPEVQQELKTLKVGNHQLEAYVYRDPTNNTIEYRTIHEFIGFPKGHTPVGNYRKLNFESRLPLSKFKRIEKIESSNVPTVYVVSHQVRGFVDSILSNAHSIQEQGKWARLNPLKEKRRIQDSYTQKILLQSLIDARILSANFNNLYDDQEEHKKKNIYYQTDGAIIQDKERYILLNDIYLGNIDTSNNSFCIELKLLRGHSRFSSSPTKYKTTRFKVNISDKGTSSTLHRLIEGQKSLM